MKFALLETIRFDTMDELQKLGFANNSPKREEMRAKYPDKVLSFQSSSCVAKNEHLLNVFEEIE